MACIDLPAFPLQLLLRRHPEWRRLPAAVVAEDRPQGRILWVNEPARQHRVLPGMRYAAGLALAFNLCAGVVAAGEIEAAVGEVVAHLRRFSPHVEPAAGEPGVLWLNASGFGRLFPSLAGWGHAIHDALRATRLAARIAVGFTRFGAYAVARTPRREAVRVLATPEEESALARAARLERLALDPAARESLAALGIATAGAFLELPPGGLLRRYGPAVHRLQRRARGDLRLPMQPRPEVAPLAGALVLDAPESDRARLLFLIKRLLHPLLDRVAARQQAVAELALELRLDDGSACGARLRPAAPTVDARRLLHLVMLRLESVRLAAGVVELRLEAGSAPAAVEQLSLFAEQHPRRDLEAAARAFARLRAQLGDDVVVRARLCDGHLPEASFAWEPLARLVPARPRRGAGRRILVRRFFDRPAALSGPPRAAGEDATGTWTAAGEAAAAAGEAAAPDDEGAAVRGPYVLSGGWWRREIAREYRFVRDPRGEWLWVYFDRRRRRWFMQGRID